MNDRPDHLKARVSAGTAIFRGDRILLLHRSINARNPGIWDLPGGHVEPRETLATAAKRETLEETGFEVRLGQVCHVEVFNSISARGKMRQTVGVYYHAAAPTRKEPRLDTHEHQGFAWVPLESIGDYPTLPVVNRAVRAAFRTKGMRPPRAKSSTAPPEWRSVTSTTSVFA